MGNPNQLSLGPGLLKIAAEAAAEPTDLVTAWPAAYVDLGYTHDGNEFGHALTLAPVEVAEELDALFQAPTGRAISVKFVLAQITAKNLQRACNGGTIVTGSGYVTFEPPPAGVPTYYKYGWQSDDGQERWVFRKCINGGTATIPRKKGADKAGIAFELMCVKPAGVQPFIAIFDTTRAA